MKKLSLLFVFVMLFVMLFAFNAFAATYNDVTDDAKLTQTDSTSVLVTEDALEKLRDGNYNTAATCGDAGKTWINYHFIYEEGTTVSKVFVVVNSTGENFYESKDAEGNLQTGVYEELTQNTFKLFVRLYDADNNVVWAKNDFSITDATAVDDGQGNVLYTAFTFTFETPYADIHKVEVAANNTVRVATDCIWEVEIYDYACVEEADHSYTDATCAAPATCIYCGATTGDKASEHTGTWSEATCTTPSTCSVCGATQGEVSTEHAWIDATCVSLKTCSVCGKTEGDLSTEHAWKNASYTAPATCKLCGITKGDVWVDSTLTNFIRGEEGDQITYEDIVGEVTLTEGSSNGDGGQNIPDGTKPLLPEEVLDGSLAANSFWAGPTNSSIKITLKNEWEINEAKLILIGNWASLKVGFYAADGTLLGEKNIGGIQCNYDYFSGKVQENPTYTDYSSAVSGLAYGDSDKAVKYILITNTGDKWGWVPGVVEVYFKGRERIPTACEKHEFEEKVITPATCTTAGSKQNVCKVCGVAEGAVSIPAFGHTMGEYRIKTPATCITAPVLEFECKTCGETIERDANVKDVTDYIDLESVVTEGAGAWTHKHYSMFNNNMDSYLMASGGWYVQSETALDMNYYISSVTVWVGNGRYDTAGTNSAWMIFYYQAPGSDEWVEAGRMETPATYQNTKYEYTLELAEPVYADAIKIYVGGPNGGYNGGGPGLESYNGVVYEAEVAGSIVKDTAAGHTWVAGETVAPDCDDFGYTNYTCSVCGATKKDDIVRETKDHKYTILDNTVETTKEEDGTVTITWQPSDPTCTEAGSYKNKCETCNGTKKFSIDPLGHKWVDATCTTPKTCSVCSTTEGEALGHAWDDATCITPKTCSVCNETDGEALGHTLVDLKCSVCNKYVVTSTSEYNTAYGKAVDGDTILFAADVTFVYIKIEKAITVDLGGNTITTTNSHGGVQLWKGASLVNGKLLHTGRVAAIKVWNATTIENLEIEVKYDGAGGEKTITCIALQSSGSTRIDSIKNVYMHGNNTSDVTILRGIETYNCGATEQDVIGSMENVTIDVNNTGMLVFAPVGTATNCTIKGGSVGILFRAASSYQSTLTLVNCKVESGDTALNIWNDSSANKDSKLILKSDANTTFTSENGSKYTASIGGNIDNVSIEISGVQLAALANGTLYETFEEAYAATPAGGKIELLANLELPTGLVIDKEITIDLNVYTISAPNDTEGNGVFHVVGGGKLTIVGSGTVNGVGNNINNIAIWADGGEVIINGGTFTNVGESLTEDHYDLIYVKNGGKVTINGGTFIAQTPKWTLNLNDSNGGTIVVNGGKFYNYDPRNSTSENPAANFAVGKCVIEDNDYYVVDNHEYFYPCDKICMVCNELSNPDAEHAVVHVDAVEATCTENGNIEYWYCSYCGSTWADEAQTQVTNQRSVIIPAAGHSYFYPCDAHCMNCGELTNENAAHTIGHVDAVEATCTAMGNVEYWYCSDCGAVWTDEALTQTSNRMSVVTFKDHEYFYPCDAHCMNCGELTNENAAHTIGHVDAVEATCTAMGNVEYWYCSDCGAVWTDEALTQTSNRMSVVTFKDHTEEIIPAVLPLPSNGHKGSTAGVKCLECGEILVAPVEITAKANDNASFKINTAALALSDGITLIYKATLPAGYEDAYIVFEYRGEEEVVSTKVYSEEEGRYHFRFSKVTPQYMGENITATMYANVNGEYVLAYKSIDYSVRAYCVSQLSKNIDDKLRTLISDFLVYGANAQIATGKDEVLVTEGLTLSPSTFEKLDATQNVKGVSGTKASEADWSTATLSLGSSVNMLFKFYAEDLEGLQIKITIKDREQTINAIDCVDTAEAYNNKTRYTATFTNITAIEFGETVTAVFLKDGVQIGRTVMYSVNSYIYENQDKVTGSLLDLLKALYNYGKAAYNSVN